MMHHSQKLLNAFFDIKLMIYILETISINHVKVGIFKSRHEGEWWFIGLNP